MVEAFMFDLVAEHGLTLLFDKVTCSDKFRSKYGKR